MNLSLNFRYLGLGAITALSIVALLSATPDSSDNIEFVPTATGMAIYNQISNTLYVYQMWNGKIASTPKQTLHVAADGSELTTE